MSLKTSHIFCTCSKRGPRRFIDFISRFLTSNLEKNLRVVTIRKCRETSVVDSRILLDRHAISFTRRKSHQGLNQSDTANT